MIKLFKRRLPEKIIDLVDKIESYAGTSINIDKNPYPISQTDPNPHALSCTVTESSATIFFRYVEDFTPPAALHELLHIYRYWVEMVPQIYPKNSNKEKISITSDIENSLEHLIIVPKELDYGFEPYGYWNRTAKLNWERYPWPDIRDTWARRKNCLLGSLSVFNIVQDINIKNLAEECIKKEGLHKETIRFNKEIKACLRDKNQLLSVVLKTLRIPPDDAIKVIFDIRNKRRIFNEVNS